MQSNDQWVMQVENINLDTVSWIQRYLEPCEVMSLIFLLEEYPERALEKLINYQRMTEIGGRPVNILLDWVKDEVCKRDFWKWELVDALFTCQLFSVIKKIGIDTCRLKQYLATSHYKYIAPFKKQLYKVCEQIDSSCYVKLKNKISEDYNVEITDYENCEILFLQLMCKKFFTIPSCASDFEIVNVDKLVKVLEQIEELSDAATEIKFLVAIFYNNRCVQGTSVKETEFAKEKQKNRILQVSDFNESFMLLNELTMEDVTEHLKTDILKLKC